MPFLGRFKNFLDLNDSKFNAKFVSCGYILLYDTGFYSEMSKTVLLYSGTAVQRYSGTVLDKNV